MLKVTISKNKLKKIVIITILCAIIIGQSTGIMWAYKPVTLHVPRG